MTLDIGILVEFRKIGTKKQKWKCQDGKCDQGKRIACHL
jgi:hypothetical protein